VPHQRQIGQDIERFFGALRCELACERQSPQDLHGLYIQQMRYMERIAHIQDAISMADAEGSPQNHLDDQRCVEHTHVAGW
jgi:hypothetical protein